MIYSMFLMEGIYSVRSAVARYAPSAENNKFTEVPK